MANIFKKVSLFIKKVDKWRTVGNWKVSFKPILPIKLDNEDEPYPRFKKGKGPKNEKV